MAGIAVNVEAPALQMAAHRCRCVAAFGQVQGLSGGKGAFHQQDGSAVALGAALAGGVQLRILGVDGHIKGDAAEIGGVPLAVAALFGGHNGDILVGQAAAVGYVTLGHQRVAVHKAQRQVREGQRHIALCQEVIIAHRLGDASVTHAVDAGGALVHEGVAGYIAAQRVLHIAGDGTHLLGGSVDDDHCAAVFHGLAAAYDAADLFRAGKAALGAAFAHDRLAGTSHAAHTLGVLGVHGAKAVAADGRAHLHAAHDAACVFLLRGHGAVVGAVTHDHTGFKGKVQRLAAIDGKVILGIQVVLAGHGTGDAAGVDVGVDIALVDAVGDLSLHVLLGVLVRDIVDEVVRVGGDVPAGAGKRLADLVHLGRDGADVVDEGLQVVVGVAAQAADRIGDAG